MRPTGVVSALAAGLTLLFCLAPSPGRAASPPPWPEVPPADLAAMAPSDFTDDEIDLPYYVAHFHRLANRVVESRENDEDGFIDVHVWRNARDQRPHNARIMESILSLAYFYATKRPWNPYHASPAVRVRLEAALAFWCRQQHVDGRFAEYGPGEWNLAPTAFATKFMAETLTLLKNGPPVDPEILARAVAVNRKAIEATLTLPELNEHGREFSNQYTNVYAGGLGHLALYPDPDLAARLEKSIREKSSVFQSPAGFFYEQKGPDWSYNLGTHQSNIRMELHYTRGTGIGRIILDEETRFVEWLSYNAVLEPDDRGFTLNRGIETRQRFPYFSRLDFDRRAAFPEDVPLSPAFLVSREENAVDLARRREEQQQAWPRVRPFVEGNSGFNPYTFLHRRHPMWLPTAAQRREAIAALPYMKSERFVHQRMDDRQGLVFTFVREPRYYAAFNSGRRLMRQQRYGLGLLWTRANGALLQSQTGTRDAAWGTLAEGARQVYEAADLEATFEVGGSRVAPKPGPVDLPAGSLAVRYALGREGAKSLAFGASEIVVDVQHPGAFDEQLPLLVRPEDELAEEPGRVALRRNGATVLIVSFDDGRRARIRDTEERTGEKRVRVVSIPARDRLRYSIGLTGETPRPPQPPGRDSID